MRIQIRDLRNGDWLWIHKVILEKYATKIGSTGIAVYNALCYFANNNSQSAFPSQDTLAKYAGCSKRTAQRALEKLQKHKLVIKEKRDRYHCVYKLIKICQNGVSKNKSGQRVVQMRQSGTSDRSESPPNNNNITRLNNNSASKKILDAKYPLKR